MQESGGKEEQGAGCPWLPMILPFIILDHKVKFLENTFPFDLL